MKQRKFMLLFVLLLSVGMVLAACGGSTNEEENAGNDAEGEEKSGDDFSAAMVTDVGGVDDKSFNQSSWEGLKAFGEEHGLEKGKAGFDYAQSESEADYLSNLNRLVKDDFNLIFGIGYKLSDAIKEVASRYEDTNFAIVDSVVEGDNIASITFKEHQGSFLVGVAAALKTETDKVGFVGATESELIEKFEAGFTAGAKSVNKDIDVQVQYAGGFDKADKGKLIASNMYEQGVDVIYHAAGATGNGVFAQAKDIKKNNPEDNVWVIGVDRDQYEEGQIGEDNVTLTSMVKRVDVAVQDLSNKAKEGNFPGGELLEYGLQDEAISVADTNEEAYTEDIAKEVEAWKEKIVNGDVEVPKTRDELKKFVESL
ncbi:BMP family lipoprotein [Pontibacillus litoralis]|uniref:BMP family lipoprotein n=1 Tax=Pontibacillus litoralis TaxID=516703 RepID=UPI00055D6EC0|nr:BMP family protein [Pontibacillus litoralis]